MSEVKICRLCVNPCSEYRSLYGENGQQNVLYETIYKYFHPTILNIKEHRHLNTICLPCRRHICDFHSFQKSVLLAQLQLGEDKDKELGIVKTEAEDLEASIESVATSGESEDFRGFPEFKITDVRSEFHLHQQNFEDEDLEKENRNIIQSVKKPPTEDVKTLADDHKMQVSCKPKVEVVEEDHQDSKENGKLLLDTANQLPEVFKTLREYGNSVDCNIEVDLRPQVISKPKLQMIKRHNDELAMMKNVACSVKATGSKTSLENSKLINTKRASPYMLSPKKFKTNLKRIDLNQNFQNCLAKSVYNNPADPNIKIEKDLFSTPLVFKIDEDISIVEYASTSVPRPNSNFHRITKEFDEFIALYLPTIKCIACPSLYGKFSLLHEHFQQYHPYEQFHFKCCYYKLDSERLVEDHILQHLDRNTFKCDLCDKLHKSQFFLDCHMKRTHSDCNADQYVCEPCGRGFATMQGRHLHFGSVHIKLEKYFPHYAGHTVDYTVHTCEDCEQVLVGCLNFNEHIWRRHRLKSAAKGKVIIYACVYCPKTFKCMLTIFQHWKSVHPQERGGKFFQEFQMLE